MDTEFDEEDIVENPTLKAAYKVAPLHQNQPLPWDYEVLLIGQKINDKFIHLCELCELPILVYGRMLPCKHIFCFDCARQCEKSCGRCFSKVHRVEKLALGTVYVCTNGAPKHNTKGCRRTYLSQRDLQSHIAHRHMPKALTSSGASSGVVGGGSSGLPADNKTNLPSQFPLTQQQAAAQQVVPSGGLVTSSVGSGGLLGVHPSSDGLQSPASSLHSVHPTAQTHLTQSQAFMPPGLGDLRNNMNTPVSSVHARSGSSPLLHQAGSNTGPGNPFGGSQTQPMSDQGIYRPLDLTGQQQMQQLQQRHMKERQMQEQQQQLQHIQQQMQQQQQLQQQMKQQQQLQHMQQQMQQQQQIQQQHIQQQRMHQQDSLPGLGGSGGSAGAGPFNQGQQGSMMHSGTPGQLHPPQQMSPGPSSVPKSSSSGGGVSGGMPGPASRTNVNLITVPIQDEGQFRPLPFISPTSSQQGGGGGGPGGFQHSRPQGPLPPMVSSGGGGFSNQSFPQSSQSTPPMGFGPGGSISSTAQHPGMRPGGGLGPPSMGAGGAPMHGGMRQRGGGQGWMGPRQTQPGLMQNPRMGLQGSQPRPPHSGDVGNFNTQGFYK